MVYIPHRRRLRANRIGNALISTQVGCRINNPGFDGELRRQAGSKPSGTTMESPGSLSVADLVINGGNGSKIRKNLPSRNSNTSSSGWWCKLDAMSSLGENVNRCYRGCLVGMTALEIFT